MIIEYDIDDPHVHTDIKKIQTCSMEHLQKWFFFCQGDSLKYMVNLRDAQVNVIQ